MGECFRFIALSVLLSLVAALKTDSAVAQNFDEWTRQKKTQVRYLVKQIGGLKIYAQLAHRGYVIVEAGLKTITNIKEGNLRLHTERFASTSRVNPLIKKIFSRYKGPCTNAVNALLSDDHFDLNDDERIARLRKTIVNCNTHQP